MGDETDNPVQSCPGPCDVVIPIVYYNQPITIPYAAIRDSMAWYERAAIDEVASVRATFTRPDTKPPLSISKAEPTYVKVKGLGHAGVAFINGQTGEASYYEYGRYPPGGDYGSVRTGKGFNSPTTISFGEDYNPENGSFISLLKKLTKTNYSSGYAYEAVYIKLPNGSYDIMKAFADKRQKDVTGKSAKAYDVKRNHCFTFALEVAGEAGVNADVSAAEDLEMILVTAFDTQMDAPAGNAIELPSRQMRYLQTKYRPLNVSAEGKITNDFEFPEGIYSK